MISGILQVHQDNVFLVGLLAFSWVAHPLCPKHRDCNQPVASEKQSEDLLIVGFISAKLLLFSFSRTRPGGMGG